MVAVFYFFEEFFGKGEDSFECGERSVGGMTACDLCEVVEFDFECEGVSNELLAREAFDKFGYDMVEFDDDGRGASDVAFEGMFATD